MASNHEETVGDSRHNCGVYLTELAVLKLVAITQKKMDRVKK